MLSQALHTAAGVRVVTGDLPGAARDLREGVERSHQIGSRSAFYVSVFPNSRITAVSRYGKEAGPKAGTALTVSFELDGHAFTALNGGPEFKFTEAGTFDYICVLRPRMLGQIIVKETE